MRKLSDILLNTEIVELIGSTEVEVKSICFDSRKVETGSMFIATRGVVSDGHERCCSNCL